MSPYAHSPPLLHPSPYLSAPRRQTDVFEILSADIGAVQEVTVRLVGVNKCGELLGVLVGEGTKLGGRWRGLLVGGLLDALV